MSAPYGRRAVAFCVDVVVALIPLWLLMPVFVIMLSAGNAENRLAVEVTAAATLPLALVLYYLVALTQGLRGKPTIGQRWARIERRTTDGEQLPLKLVIARYVGLGLAPAGLVFAAGLWPLLGLIPLSALIVPSGQNAIDYWLGIVACDRTVIGVGDPCDEGSSTGDEGDEQTVASADTPVEESD